MTTHLTDVDEDGDAEALADVIRLGLRRCRVEDAPSPLIREGDLTHATYMVEQAVSDWLAAHDEQARREAWDEGYQRGLRDAACPSQCGWGR